MNKIVFFLAFALLFSMSFSSAVCTVTFDKNEHSPTETISVASICDNKNNKRPSGK